MEMQARQMIEADRSLSAGIRGYIALDYSLEDLIERIEELWHDELDNIPVDVVTRTPKPERKK